MSVSHAHITCKTVDPTGFTEEYENACIRCCTLHDADVVTITIPSSISSMRCMQPVLPARSSTSTQTPTLLIACSQPLMSTVGAAPSEGERGGT
jgi:hypothetical protein